MPIPTSVKSALGDQGLAVAELLEPESEWVKIDARVAPVDGETVIEKQWASGFFNTDLAQRLEAAGADSIVVGGLTTSGCVRATAVDGLQNDYRVVIAREATGDRNLAAHESNLFDLQAKYVDVLALQDVLDILVSLPGCVKEPSKARLVLGSLLVISNPIFL